jgi:hypothetical protein
LTLICRNPSNLNNKIGRSNPAYFILLYKLLFVLGKAVSAVYRLVAAGLERYLSIFAALRANSGEHLACAASVTATIAEFLGSSG